MHRSRKAGEKVISIMLLQETSVCHSTFKLLNTGNLHFNQNPTIADGDRYQDAHDGYY